MVTIRNKFRYIETNEGNRVKKYEELPEIVDAFIYKITNRRYDLASSKLIDDVMTESERLFKLVVCNSMNVADISPELREYTSRPWRDLPLTKKWTDSKGHSNFWYGKGLAEKGGHLKDYLVGKAPSQLFGMPEIVPARNEKARGFQRMTISINPYPLRWKDLRERMDSNQYDKLFGTRKSADGGYTTNEEERPLISPAIQYMIEKRIMKAAQNSLAKSMNTGKETIRNGKQ